MYYNLFQKLTTLFDFHFFIGNPILILCKEHIVVYLGDIPQFRLVSRTALSVGTVLLFDL